MHTCKQHSYGQTLLELVIAIGVVAVIVTGLVVAATSSLRYGQDSRLRSTGVKYAQEGLEYARQIRDTQPPNTFLSYSGGGSESWCLDQTGAWTVNGGSCPPIASGSPYSRTVTFTWNDPIMTVVSLVSWNEGGTVTSTQLQTDLTQWR